MLAARRSVVTARPTNRNSVALPRPVARKAEARRPVTVRASSSGGGDFDDLLIKWAEKFEAAPNKPAVVGYIAAAVFVFFTAEWLIHLPALDVLLGFPVQLLGLLMLPYLGLRYLVDGKDVGSDVAEYTSAITKKLPGLDK